MKIFTKILFGIACGLLITYFYMRYIGENNSGEILKTISLYLFVISVLIENIRLNTELKLLKEEFGIKNPKKDEIS